MKLTYYPKSRKLARDNAAQLIRSLRKNFTRPGWMAESHYIECIKAMIKTLHFAK